MPQALSNYSQLYTSADVADFINKNGVFPEYDFERLRQTIPFLYFSRNVALDGSNQIAIVDSAEMNFEDAEVNTYLHNPVAVNVSTRMSKGKGIKLAFPLTNYMASNISISWEGLQSTVQTLINGVQEAFYRKICERFIAAVDENIFAVNVIGTSGGTTITPAQDSVGVIDATTTGFTEATLASIQSYFYANVSEAKENIENFYLVLPYSAREKWLETIGNPNNAISYETYATMKNVTYIRGHPVFTPPNKFFKRETIGGKTGIVGYAVLQNGFAFGYVPAVLTPQGLVNSTNLPLQATSAELRKGMYRIMADPLQWPHVSGIGIRAEGTMGIIRAFKGAVVKILLPDEQGITIN